MNSGSELDQVTFFIYPDSEALRNDLINESPRNYVDTQLKHIWESDIKPIVDSMSQSYFWHDEGIHWELVDKTANPCDAFFNGKVKFGDGMEDEWFVLRILMKITACNDTLVATIFDSDGDFILIEAAEVLPSWLEPEFSKNRVFVHEGKIKIIPIEHFPKQPSIQEALKFLRSGECPIDSEINRIISEKLDEQANLNCQLHHARLRVPLKVAQILHREAKLIGPAVSAFYHRDPETVRICTEMPLFNPRKSGGELVCTTVPMTRIQFAQLACQDFAAPFNENVDFDTLSCEFPVVSELGMKLTCGFEMLMAAESDKFINIELFEETSRPCSVQYKIREILRDTEVDPCTIINDRPEDSLDWMRLVQSALEAELQGKFESLAMDETEKTNLLDTWTREFDGKTAEKSSEMKNELSEIDLIVDKMKKMIESTSNFEGIDDEPGKANESETSSDENSSDEDFLEKEIFETINFDPDLFMKILEVNANMGVCSDDFIQKFRRYQQENPVTSASEEIHDKPKKGLADIDAEKVSEARVSRRRVFEEEVETVVSDSVSEDEAQPDDFKNISESDNDYGNDEFIYGNDDDSASIRRNKQQEVSSISSSDEECEDSFENYYSSMDSQLKAELKDAGFFDESGLVTNLGKNLIESMASVKGSSTSPIETILASLGKRLPDAN
jgi:hypothetical protein